MYMGALFASTIARLRLEARSGEEKTLDKLQWLTELLEQAQADIKEALKLACEPVRHEKQSVKFVEEQWVLKMRGAVGQALWVRKIDMRSKGLKAITTVVQPLVAKEAERVAKLDSSADDDGVSLAAEFSKRLDSEGGRIGIVAIIGKEIG